MQTLLLWTIVLTASAQSLSPARNGKQKDPTVNVRGCVHGTALLLSEDPGFDVPGRKLDLQGSRRMMRALKEHNSHQEEIVGVLKTRSRNSSVAVKEKRGEKTRVWVGVSETRSESIDDITAQPTLDVRGMTHLGPRCQ